MSHLTAEGRVTAPPWRWAWLGLIALAATVVVGGLAYQWEPVDDAYISCRYAKNQLGGHGLVFNPGERVEGYTNFLWTEILAFAGLFAFDIPTAAKWLGACFACIALGLTWLLARRVAEERGWPIGFAWAPAAMLACYPGWCYWGFSGMEGPLLACLVLGFLLVGCSPTATAMSIVLAGILGILAAMTRWEAVLLWPVAVALQLFGTSRSKARRLRLAAILSTVLLVGFGVYFAWRFSYYGEIMPNTYYAKAGGTFLSRSAKGVAYTGELAVGWLLPVTFVVWLSGCRRRW